jgi:hypothetical protein
MEKKYIWNKTFNSWLPFLPMPSHRPFPACLSDPLFFTFPFPHFTLSLHFMLPPPTPPIFQRSIPTLRAPCASPFKGGQIRQMCARKGSYGGVGGRGYCKSGRFVTVRTCGSDRWSLRNRHRQRMEIATLKIYLHESVYICLLYQCA